MIPVVGDVAAMGKLSKLANKVVIGENMPQRVIPFAKKIGASYFKARGTNSKYFMRNNRQWIRRQMRQGKEIFDIGIERGRAIRSPYYRMEKEMLKKYNYPTK